MTMASSAQHVLTTRQWCCDTEPQQPPHRCGAARGNCNQTQPFNRGPEQCLIVNASEKLLKKEKFVFIIQNSFHLRAEIVKFSINRISPASTSTSPASSDYILLNKRTKETETCDPELGYKHTTLHTIVTLSIYTVTTSSVSLINMRVFTAQCLLECGGYTIQFGVR